MELKGRIITDFTLTAEEAVALLMAVSAAKGESPTAKSTDATMSSAIDRVKVTAAKLEKQATPDAAPVKTECKEEVPATEAPAQPAQPAQPEQPEQPGEDKPETPEMAVSLLKDRFGIPYAKEERTKEQQEKAMAMNRAVTQMIRDITRNEKARSLADLKSDMEKKEFIRRSLYLGYDGQCFEELPF